MSWGMDSSHVSDRGYTGGAAQPVTLEQRRSAVRVLAGNAADATELAEWLAMLGLKASEGKK